MFIIYWRTLERPNNFIYNKNVNDNLLFNFSYFSFFISEWTTNTEDEQIEKKTGRWIPWMGWWNGSYLNSQAGGEKGKHWEVLAYSVVMDMMLTRMISCWKIINITKRHYSLQRLLLMLPLSLLLLLVATTTRLLTLSLSSSSSSFRKWVAGWFFVQCGVVGCCFCGLFALVLCHLYLNEMTTWKCHKFYPRCQKQHYFPSRSSAFHQYRGSESTFI